MQLHRSALMPSFVAASIAPYAIGSSTPVENYPGADWIGMIDSQVFEAGPEKIDACLICETATHIIFSVRATVLFSRLFDVQLFTDWLNDLRVDPITAPGFSGQLHKGFYQSMVNLEAAGALQAVQDRVEASHKPLVICGYSKGAGVAPIVAMRLQQSGFDMRQLAAVVLFEPPRAGDRFFADAYEVALGEKTIRYAYQDDLVPHLPPSQETLTSLKDIPVIGALLSEIYGDYQDWMFVPVGHLQFIDWDGNIRPYSEDLDRERTQQLIQKIKRLDFRKIILCHLPCTGFAKILVPDRKCPWTF